MGHAAAASTSDPTGLSTNLLALLAVLSPRAHSVPVSVPATTSNLSSSAAAAISAQVAAIARELDATRLVPHRASAGDGTGTTLPPELLLFLSPHTLPLGRDARTGHTHMPASVAHACFGSPSTLALLAAFATYASHAACPRNATLAHRLVSKARMMGCAAPRTPRGG